MVLNFPVKDIYKAVWEVPNFYFYADRHLVVFGIEGSDLKRTIGSSEDYLKDRALGKVEHVCEICPSNEVAINRAQIKNERRGLI